MLHADKLAFEANLCAQDLVAIQMKELDYLYKNLANLATSSAVLVGFGFSGVTAFASDDLTTRAEHAQCFGIHLDEAQVKRHRGHLADKRLVDDVEATRLAMTTALGLGLDRALHLDDHDHRPGEALRGPEGSLTVALRHMEQEPRAPLLRPRNGGVLVDAAFVQLAFAKALVVIVVGAYVIRKISYYGNDIGARFHLACGRAVAASSTRASRANSPRAARTRSTRAAATRGRPTCRRSTCRRDSTAPKLGQVAARGPHEDDALDAPRQADRAAVPRLALAARRHRAAHHRARRLQGGALVGAPAARASSEKARARPTRLPTSCGRRRRSRRRRRPKATRSRDVLEQISQMAVAAGVAYAPDEKDDDGGWSWWPFGRGAERPDSAERERRREALGQPASRRAPPKSKKNVKLDVEMGGGSRGAPIVDTIVYNTAASPPLLFARSPARAPRRNRSPARARPSRRRSR